MLQRHTIIISKNYLANEADSTQLLMCVCCCQCCQVPKLFFGQYMKKVWPILEKVWPIFGHKFFGPNFFFSDRNFGHLATLAANLENLEQLRRQKVKRGLLVIHILCI
jgi:hypothetical protein